MADTKILVVDDLATNRTLVRAAMEKAGFQVLEAEDAETALGLLDTQVPDLIITDVMMPKVDGYELVRRIRKNPVLAGVPVIVLTAKGELADKVAGFEAGADDYLVKPVELEELQLRVRALLARRGVTPALRGEVPRLGRIFAVFGCKGGVGTTTIAANLAVALYDKKKDREVALIDADLSFGDLALHMNAPPVHTISDLVSYTHELDAGLLAQVMVDHPSGIKVLLGPPRPERAEEVSATLMASVLDVAASNFDYIVVDTQRVYNSNTLVVLDKADVILLVLTADIGALRNASLFLTLAESLGYPRNKVMPVLNGVGVQMGIEMRDVRRVLGGKEPVAIDSGGIEVAKSANKGEPVILRSPRNKMARAIKTLAEELAQ